MGRMLSRVLVGLCALATSGCMPMLIHEAETPATRGQVLDGIDGQPVAGVQVALAGQRGFSDEDLLVVTDVTDEQGRFQLEEKSRRRVVMAMPGSHIRHFPLRADDETGARSAHSVVPMAFRTRAGESDRHVLLMLLPENPRSLPPPCADLDTFAYAIHAVESLPRWREQDWFRRQILEDTRSIRQFADGLERMLRHLTPDCHQATGVAERVDRANQMLRSLIEQEPYYRYPGGKVPGMPAPGSVRPGDYPAPDGYGSEVRFAGMRGNLAFVLDTDRVVSHVIFEPEEALDDSGARVAEELSPVVQRLSALLGFAPREGGWKHLVWDSAAHDSVYEAMLLDTAGGGAATRVILRSRDPSRLCGPEDGFAEWFAGLQRAIAEDRRDQVANAFRYPFIDQAGNAMGVDPDERLHFDDAAGFLERYRRPEVREMLARIAGADSPGCLPYGHEGRLAGYAIPAAQGMIQAYPRSDGWRLVVVYYLP